mgnify:CR=1 FL=1
MITHKKAGKCGLTIVSKRWYYMGVADNDEHKNG